MKNQPLTPADCARQGIPLPEGTTTLNAWHRSEDGVTVLRTHHIANDSEESIARLLETPRK